MNKDEPILEICPDKVSRFVNTLELKLDSCPVKVDILELSCEDWVKILELTCPDSEVTLEDREDTSELSEVTCQKNWDGT